MDKLRGIHVTDEKNRYNETIAPEAIFKAYERQWREYLPSNFEHDMTEPIGCSRADGLFFAPKIMYGLNVFMAGETGEESVGLANFGLNCQIKAELENNSAEFDELERALKPHLVNPSKYVFNGVYLHDTDLVKRVFPELWESADGDGLIDLNLLTPFCGAYRVGDDGRFVVYAHKFFRRSFSHLNSLNADFLKRLNALRGTDKSVKIAIDPNCVGLASAQRHCMEYAYWWGPKFDDSLSDIPVGVTVHANEMFDKCGYGAKRTEFYWYDRNGRRTFECEEISGVAKIKNGGERLNGCRYTHSIVDGVPVHLDGAVRMYSATDMEKRERIYLDKTDRRADYVKLWRVDGAIPVETWKELITHFYRDNMQIGEYLGGNDPQYDDIRAEKEQSKDSGPKLSDYVPCTVKRSSGLRLKFFFCEKSNTPDGADIFVAPTDYFSQDGKTRQMYYEAEVATLNKLIERGGAKCDVAPAEFVNYLDDIHNFPMYVCTSVAAAQRLIEAVKTLTCAWTKHGRSAVISFSLKVPYETKAAVYSFLGHSAQFSEYFQSNAYEPLPTEEAQICEWCLRFYKAISTAERNSDAEPFDVIEDDGLLYAKRIFVDPKCIVASDKDDEGVAVSLKLNTDEAAFLEQNGIYFRGVLRELQTECSKCKRDYHDCGCVTYVDEGVYKIIEKAKNLGYVWAADVDRS